MYKNWFRTKRKTSAFKKRNNKRKHKPTRKIRRPMDDLSEDIKEETEKQQEQQENHNQKPQKKLNCSPVVQGKTPTKDTCFTNDVLEKIKADYNKDNPNRPIVETDPLKIWQELNWRLSNTCPKEDCWLKQIKNQELRDRLDAMVFAPTQPKEWRENPAQWLDNFNIADVMKQYEKAYPHFRFIGPTPIDFKTRPRGGGGQCVWQELCAFSLKRYVGQKVTKIGIVFNLDKHNQKGSHWISMFIDLENRFIFYFDSAGGWIPDEITKFGKLLMKQATDLGLHYTYYKNARKQHQRQNTECGVYSLFFIVTMLTRKLGGGVDDKHTETLPFSKLRDLFLHGNIPDEYVQHYRDLYYNKR
jgi:hypothetical protein